MPSLHSHQEDLVKIQGSYNLPHYILVVHSKEPLLLSDLVTSS